MTVVDDTLDEPTAPDPRFLLRHLGGAKPPAPEWFAKILAQPSTEGRIELAEGAIGWRRWEAMSGAVEAPTVVLLHGALAHKGWWDFVAPWLTERWRVVALDLPGMGASDHRDRYSLPRGAESLVAAMDALGVFDGGLRPALVGHSFGGLMSLMIATEAGERFSRAVLVDIPVRPREDNDDAPPKRAGGRAYASEAEALARFRLIPPQPVGHLFLADYAARTALKPAPMEDGREGVTWAHDPGLWIKYERLAGDGPTMAKAARCPLAHVRAADSRLVDDERWAWMRSHVTGGDPMVSIANAGHHVMLDQPEALAATLDAVLTSTGADQVRR